MDIGNKWVYVYYVDLGNGPVKHGLSLEVTEAGKDEEGRKYWTVLSQFLDADGNVTGGKTVRYSNKGAYRWVQFDPLLDPHRVLPRWFRVANSGLQTYCLERDHGECVSPVFTAVGYVRSLATDEWIEARNAEFGFDVTKVYGRQWLLGALEYDDSMLSAPGEPVYILKVHVGPVVMGGNQLLQYVKLKNKERTFFEY